jgi:GTPase SAR1 family protein
MKIRKSILPLLSMVWAISGLAMEATAPPPQMGMMIPEENQIRLVFMGKTGAGKSTLINAFYNYAQRVKWNESKHYVIPTEFQSCTVSEYQGRVVEKHAKGQLESVTQEPSEYISRNNTFVVSLIDCPGVADTRGITQDIDNTAKIAEFMKKTGSFNAICIVLPVTINRDTAETAYFIEQLKTIIPASAHKRIFTCVSYSTAENHNIEDFVKSIGLLTENIFYFDNYPISKDGYKIDLTVNLDADDEEVDDFFDTNDDISSSADRQKKIANARKAKDAWVFSNLAFQKLLRKAKSLGRYTSDDMTKITEIKNKVLQGILKAYNKIEVIEYTEDKIKDAEIQLQLALDKYTYALQNKDSADQAFYQAQLDKQTADALRLFDDYRDKVETKTPNIHNTHCTNCDITCHPSCGLEFKGLNINDHITGCSCLTNNSCTQCPKGCPYSVHFHKFFKKEMVTKSRENTGVKNQQSSAAANYNTWQKTAKDREQELNDKTSKKDDSDNILQGLKDRLQCLQKERADLQHKIVELYVELGKVSMSSINFHIGEYYDICIRKETDKAKVAKLNRERTFYTEQVELYKQKMASNNT